MNKRTTVLLDTPYSEFVDRQIDEGNFSSPDEVVRAGLHLLEEQQARLERLRAAIIEGEESGKPQPFDFDEFLERMHARVAG